MPSWSEIVSPRETREKEVAPKNPVKKEPPPLLCTTCRNRNAIVCEDCKKRPLYQGPYCGGCYVDRIWRTLGSDSMCIGYIRASNPKNDPPLECIPCSKQKAEKLMG
jgi:hypothetical protein